MFVAISTEIQTGETLGRVEAICDTQPEALRKAAKFHTKNGFGLIRRIVSGRVEVGETVKFSDRRFRIDQPVKVRKYNQRKELE